MCATRWKQRERVRERKSKGTKQKRIMKSILVKRIRCPFVSRIFLCGATFLTINFSALWNTANKKKKTWKHCRESVEVKQKHRQDCKAKIDKAERHSTKRIPFWKFTFFFSFYFIPLHIQFYLWSLKLFGKYCHQWNVYICSCLLFTHSCRSLLLSFAFYSFHSIQWKRRQTNINIHHQISHARNSIAFCFVVVFFFHHSLHSVFAHISWCYRITLTMSKAKAHTHTVS